MGCPLSVWWDLNSCPPSHDTEPLLLANRMQSAFLQLGLPWGIQSFSAYGDASRFSPSLQHSLADAAISLCHTPPGQTSMKGIMAMMVDMLTWALEHAAPANFVVITSNTEFANPLHKLRMKCYNIVLICLLPDSKLSLSLTNAATVALEWPSLKLLPEAMELDNDMGGVVDRDDNTSEKRSSKEEDEDTADIHLIESSEMEKVKKARIDDSQILGVDDSRKRPDLCTLPSKTASESQKAMIEERVGSREEPLLTDFKSWLRSKGGRMRTSREVMTIVEPWLQYLVTRKEAARGIPILSLGERFRRDTGVRHNLRRLLGEELHIALIQFRHIVRLKRRGSTLVAFPATPCEGGPLTVQKPGTQKRKKAELTESCRKAILEPWLLKLMATEEAARGIPISSLVQRFQRETGVTMELPKFLSKKVTSGLLQFKHILRLERTSNDILVFPTIS